MDADGRGYITRSYGEVIISLQNFFSTCSHLSSIFHILQALDHPVRIQIMVIQSSPKTPFGLVNDGSLI